MIKLIPTRLSYRLFYWSTSEEGKICVIVVKKSKIKSWLYVASAMVHCISGVSCKPSLSRPGRPRRHQSSPLYVLRVVKQINDDFRISSSSKIHLQSQFAIYRSTARLSSTRTAKISLGKCIEIFWPTFDISKNCEKTDQI